MEEEIYGVAGGRPGGGRSMNDMQRAFATMMGMMNGFGDIPWQTRKNIHVKQYVDSNSKNPCRAVQHLTLGKHKSP